MSVHWMAKALCVGADPDLFFPADDSSADEARQVCSLCPVTAECLEYALNNELSYGVFGGLLPRQRARMRPEFRRCAACRAAMPKVPYRTFCQACAAQRRSAQHAMVERRRRQRRSAGSGPAVTGAQGPPVPLSSKAVP